MKNVNGSYFPKRTHIFILFSQISRQNQKVFEQKNFLFFFLIFQIKQWEEQRETFVDVLATFALDKKNSKCLTKNKQIFFFLLKTYVGREWSDNFKERHMRAKLQLFSELKHSEKNIKHFQLLINNLYSFIKVLWNFFYFGQIKCPDILINYRK
jgi:hypothetical protein